MTNLFEDLGKTIGDVADGVAKETGKMLDNSGKAVGEAVNVVTKTTSDVVQSGTNLTTDSMMTAMNWAYKTGINGLPGEKTVYELADEYLSKYDKEKAIDKLIQAQTTKAAVSGFVTGFGGLLTLPVTIPANISSVLVFQMRMIAAIAHIRGYDLKDNQVQTLVYMSLLGTSLTETVKGVGIQVASKVTTNMLKKLPGTVLTRINRAVGFRLMTKFGQKGLINLYKAIPVAGAVVSASLDMGTTIGLATYAKSFFVQVKEKPQLKDVTNEDVIDEEELISALEDQQD